MVGLVNAVEPYCLANLTNLILMELCSLGPINRAPARGPNEATHPRPKKPVTGEKNMGIAKSQLDVIALGNFAGD